MIHIPRNHCPKQIFQISGVVTQLCRWFYTEQLPMRYVSLFICFIRPHFDHFRLPCDGRCHEVCPSVELFNKGDDKGVDVTQQSWEINPCSHTKMQLSQDMSNCRARCLQPPSISFFFYFVLPGDNHLQQDLDCIYHLCFP